MQSAAAGSIAAELASRLDLGVKSHPVLISKGYQGSIHLVELRGRRFIVKTPHGRGLTRRIRLAMLRNEHRVYQQLAGVENVPACHGLIDGRHLLLEYIEGANLRYATIGDREAFYDRLLGTIQNLHRHRVAHGDLKKKDNVVVDGAGRPFVVDFGVAVVRRDGFHPLNRLLFRLSRSMDLNAWVKHKYGGYHGPMTAADRQLLRFTPLERISRRLRGVWDWLRRGSDDS